MEQVHYWFACGGDVTLRDLDIAIAVGQRSFLVSVDTPAARHLRALRDVTVVLDSGAWPPNNPSRPPFDAWWQEIRRWREGRNNYGNLSYAIAYDTIGCPAQTGHDYRVTMGRVFARCPDAPIVPVLSFGTPPAGIALDLLAGWAGTRPDLVDGDGLYHRPVYVLGGLVPQHGSAQATTWVQSVAHELRILIAEGWDETMLGIHILGSTRRQYLGPLLDLGIPVWCDTSTPVRQALAGDKALAWGYTDRYGLPLALLRTSRAARVAFWLCRAREQLGLPFHVPDADWLAALPERIPIVRPQQHDLFGRMAAYERATMAL